MSNLYIPNSISLRNFESIFTNNNFDFTDKDVHITFHHKYVAMHPIGIVFYAALHDYFIENGIKYDGRINKSITSIPYLQRMGLFRGLGFSDLRQIKCHDETGRFIPLTRIKSNEDLDKFIKTIDPILHTTRENSRAIKHVFSELLRNVIEHAESKYGGFVCATYNKKRKKISIGISDSGIGLFNSLRVFHKVNSSLEAIRLALTPGISGKTARIGGTRENAGAGLFFTKCIAQSSKNYMLIYSGDAYYKLRTPKEQKKSIFNADPFLDIKTIKESLPRFNGTLVGIDITIDNNETFNGLIDSIGKAYQLSVKKSQHDYYKRIRFI
jgi:anti-sigma regulatory factor (Ser/Thr protein kinase)